MILLNYIFGTLSSLKVPKLHLALTVHPGASFKMDSGHIGGGKGALDEGFLDCWDLLFEKHRLEISLL